MISTSPLMQNARTVEVAKLIGLGLAAVGLVGLLLISVALGAADISVGTVYQALLNFNGSFDHLIIRTVRLPRVLAGALVGAALAVSGAMMQGLTRNPLASPGILGVNAGASFAVVLAVLVLGSPPLATYALFAFIGAATTAVFVYSLGSLGKGGPTPLKLTLAGAVFTAFISSFTSAILIMDQTTLDQIRFWTAGSLAGRDMALVVRTFPYIMAGLIGSFLLGRQLTTLSLGDDVAVGLGQNTGRTKMAVAGLVVLLAGGAVALAGPVGFVGLVIPHVVRLFVGTDYRWILPYAAVFGGMLMTIADIGARLVIRPQELSVGIMMALIGAPFFIFLARTKIRS